MDSSSVVSVLVFVSISLLAGSLRAQAPAPRQSALAHTPTILDSSLQARTRAVVQLKVARIAQALQAADSGALQAALDRAEFPLSELLSARSVGCVSPGWMLAEATRLRGKGRSGPALASLHVASASHAAASGDCASADLVISDERSAAIAHIEFRRDNDALLVADVTGLYTALCQVAARRVLR